MKTLLPIVGIHSAGKTTLRNELEKLGYTTEQECAENLRIEKNLVAGASATSSFEELVEQEEKKRDINRKWNTNIIFVESWHILTLAYLLTRGVKESEFEDYFKYVKNMEKVYSIHCIFLKSDPYKILERSRKLHSEEDIEEYYEFYERLGENIKYVLEKLDLDYREFNTMKAIEVTVEEVKEYLKEIE